ncbi:MAG TPA: ABC transporter permease [Terriglobales bacterium]|nr:ABC transporter permease [Terriglobales bacterium]
MSLLRLADKVLVIARRDLLTALRYRAGFWTHILGVLAEIAGFYFLARAVGPGYRPDGVGYFPFLLVGTSLYGFLFMGANAFIDSVREAQWSGTMEVLMTTSTPGPVIILLTAISAFGSRIFDFCLYFVAGFLLFGVPLEHPNLPAAVVVFLLSLLVAVAFGVIAAAFQVATQKGSSVVWLVGSVIWLTSGTLFPVSALPGWVQRISWLIPLTYSLDGLRAALLRGASLAEMSKLISVLAVYAVVLLPASLGLLSVTLRHARMRGTLSFY